MLFQSGSVWRQYTQILRFGRCSHRARFGPPLVPLPSDHQNHLKSGVGEHISSARLGTVQPVIQHPLQSRLDKSKPIGTGRTLLCYRWLLDDVLQSRFGFLPIPRPTLIRQPSSRIASIVRPAGAGDRWRRNVHTCRGRVRYSALFCSRRRSVRSHRSRGNCRSRTQRVVCQ